MKFFLIYYTFFYKKDKCITLFTFITDKHTSESSVWKVTKRIEFFERFTIEFSELYEEFKYVT